MAPPIPQDLSYHDFADRRRFLGIPNALDVLSNLPFVAVGIAGLAFLSRDRSSGSRTAFRTPAERQPYWMLFAGVTLTGFGSSYYHWNPENTTLFWDRLPMTIAFMALLSSVIAERVDLKVGIRLLWPLVALGAFSVLYWDFGERRGAGDLRPYALVQFGTLLAIPLIVWLFPPRYTATADLFIALGWYGLAKVLEYFDRPVLAAVGVSGHTLKHVASAVGAWWLLRMVERRRPAIPDASGSA